MAINPSDYSYSRNERGILMRSPGNMLIPEDDPDNGAYILYQKWIEAGNTPVPGFPQPNWPWTPPAPPEDTTTLPAPASHGHKHD